jgi:hypothetical protein
LTSFPTDNLALFVQGMMMLTSFVLTFLAVNFYKMIFTKDRCWGMEMSPFLGENVGNKCEEWWENMMMTFNGCKFDRFFIHIKAIAGF